MKHLIDDEIWKMAEVAAAGAPAFTTDQITELRRIIQPHLRQSAPDVASRDASVTHLPIRPVRKAAA